MTAYDIVRRPLVTEKSTQLKDLFRQYTFEVDPRANKYQIRQAVENIFKVHVTDIKTAVVRGKFRRVGSHQGKRPNWKKAVVTLKEGEKIEFFEGV